MIAPRLKTGSAVCAPRVTLAVLHAIAPLLVFGCVARTPLRSAHGGSSEPEGSVDTGGAAGDFVGGTVAAGGNAGTAGIPEMGGASAVPEGGTVDSGGASSAGGVVTISSGGSKASSSSRHDGGVAPDGATPLGTPTITDSGYVTVSAGTTVLAGFVSSAEGGSGSMISLTYGSSSFCASGTVGQNSTYNCWAEAGFNVNQGQSGMSGSSNSLVLSGSTISVSYVNKGGSTLELQLYDGSDYWCYSLPQSTTSTTKTIPFSSLNTKCWDNTGTPFKSGTPITAVELVVPGSAVAATPFDFCFLGMTVQ
jgi:hypothetical protein